MMESWKAGKLESWKARKLEAAAAGKPGKPGKLKKAKARKLESPESLESPVETKRIWWKAWKAWKAARRAPLPRGSQEARRSRSPPRRRSRLPHAGAAGHHKATQLQARVPLAIGFFASSSP